MNIAFNIQDFGFFGLFLVVSVIVLEYLKEAKITVFIVLNIIMALSLYILFSIPLLKCGIYMAVGIIGGIIVYTILGLFGEPSSKGGPIKGVEPIILNTHKGSDLKFYNPQENFLVYGGANAGKTKSIGKPILWQYLESGYSTFVYDAKEMDYAKTVYGYYQQKGNVKDIYFCNFADVNKSHRFNPIKPILFSNPTQFEEVNEEFLTGLAGDAQDGTWFDAGLGLFKGIAWMFYKHYPQMCTWPHICNFFLHRSTEEIMVFLERDYKAKGFASAIFKGGRSERTVDSVLFSLANYLSKIANNETICYILSGDEFDFRFTDPNKPISFCLSSSHQIAKTLNPILGALVNISSKQFTLENQNKFVYCLDEATTFKIPDFENLPSLLREFQVAFLILTQSASKLEKMYGKHDLNSLHSNMTNKFFGKTGDINAAQMYQQLFEKQVTDYTSKTESYGRQLSESKTTSQRKEFRYDTNFFSHLQPGEFVGTAGNANVSEFHARFKMYDVKKDMVPPSNEKLVTAYDLQTHHELLIKQVKQI